MRLPFLLVLGLSLVACKDKHAPPTPLAETASAPTKRREIHFEVEVPPAERQRGEEGVSPYVNLDAPEPDIARMRAREEIVVRQRKVVVVIDYPVDKPVQFPLEAPGDAGFSRAELVRAISRLYHRIYEEEERTAKQKTIPLERRGKLVNRNKTDGTYGVWGHDLGDLVLHTIEVIDGPDGVTRLELSIDS